MILRFQDKVYLHAACIMNVNRMYKSIKHCYHAELIVQGMSPIAAEQMQGYSSQKMTVLVFQEDLFNIYLNRSCIIQIIITYAVLHIKQNYYNLTTIYIF